MSTLIFPGISAEPGKPKRSISMRQTFNIHLLACYDTEACFHSEFIICEATKPAISYYKNIIQDKTYKKACATHYLKSNSYQKTMKQLFTSL